MQNFYPGYTEWRRRRWQSSARAVPVTQPTLRGHWTKDFVKPYTLPAISDQILWAPPPPTLALRICTSSFPYTTLEKVLYRSRYRWENLRLHMSRSRPHTLDNVEQRRSLANRARMGKKKMLGSQAAGGTAPLGGNHSEVNAQAARAPVTLSHVRWQLTKTGK